MPSESISQLATHSFRYFAVILLVAAVIGLAIAFVALVVLRWVGKHPHPAVVIVVGVGFAIALASPFLVSRTRHLVELYHLERTVCADVADRMQVTSCTGRVGLESNGNHCDWTIDVSLVGRVRTSDFEGMSAPTGIADIEGTPATVESLSFDEGSGVSRVSILWGGGPYSDGWDLDCM